MANNFKELANYHREMRDLKLPQQFKCSSCGELVHEIKGATSTCQKCVEKGATFIDGLGI